MKPGTILLSLIGAVTAFSGWGYAWKQSQKSGSPVLVPTPAPTAVVNPVGPLNTPFTGQEDIMFSLQDQIEILELENLDLRAQLEALRDSEPTPPVETSE